MKVVKSGMYVEDDKSISDIYVSPSTGEAVVLGSSKNPRFLVNVMVDDPLDYGEKFYNGQLAQYEGSRGVISTPTYTLIIYDDRVKFYELFQKEPFRDISYVLETTSEIYEIVKESTEC